MSDILTSITPAIIDLVHVVLVALLSWLSAEIARRVRESALRDRQRDVLERAARAMLAAVLAVEQTTVSALKRDAADGRLTADEARAAMDQALDIARAQLGATGVAALAAVTDDVDRWLRTVGEAAIAERR